MATLERAIALAAQAHEGQKDKAGEPYVLHVLRVMLRMETADGMMAAIAHDMIEDCGWTMERLRAEGFPENVVGAVDAVTRREGEDYQDFIVRAAKHPLGRLVKIADLEDNMDLTRLSFVTERDLARLEKYRRAMALLRDSG